jgi:PPM family protein phosphatase
MSVIAIPSGIPVMGIGCNGVLQITGNPEMTDVNGVELCGVSDKGRARLENQDNILVDPANSLFILADGAGGSLGGGTASRLTVDTMAATLEPLKRKISRYRLWNRRHRVTGLTEFLYHAAQTANRAVIDQASATPELTGMASTLVAGLIVAQRCIAITSGDSRIYHFHEGHLEQISRDHSLARSLIDRGFFAEDDGNAGKYRNVLTQAVGIKDDLEISAHDFPLQNGDIVLACSDGLTNMVSDKSIAAFLATADPLTDKVKALIQSANDAGGLDNISVILIRYDGLPSIFSRLLGQ